MLHCVNIELVCYPVWHNLLGERENQAEMAWLTGKLVELQNKVKHVLPQIIGHPVLLKSPAYSPCIFVTLTFAEQ